MEYKYRQHIIKNTEKLIRLTDYEKLMHACVYSGLLTHVMRQNVEDVLLNEELSNDDLQHERHRRLFLKLTKRGPDAYQRLKTLLIELKYEQAVQLLDEPRNDDTQFVSLSQREKNIDSHRDERKTLMPFILNNGGQIYNTIDQNKDGTLRLKLKKNEDELPKLSLYTEKIQPKVVHHVEKSKHMYIDSKVGIYPMRSQHSRGVFFMVNIIDFPDKKERRNGAEEDGESLLYLFKELGFKLFAYVNLTQSEFFYLLDAVIDSKYTRDAECFVMALMTHGNMDENYGERVQFHDGSIIKVRDIEAHFENVKCPHLVHKPKIFIFPFCRGEIADYGHFRTIQTDGFAENKARAVDANIPSMSDIFICYASMRGFRAHRDSLDGSWYIQKFCELMAKHAHDTDFEDIVKMIQQEIGKLRTANGAMQTGSYTNIGFNNKLFFNPGAWES